MPLRSTYGPLFTSQWVAELKSTPESAQIATVSIVTPGAATYDPATDQWVGSGTLMYAGPARVQPMQAAANREVRGNETTVQRVLFSLPIDLARGIDFRTGWLGRVTASPLNPSLLHYQYVLTEIVDSSNPIETTLLFSVNQETVT